MAAHRRVLYGAGLLSVMLLTEVAAVRDETSDGRAVETEADKATAETGDAAEEDPGFFSWISEKLSEVSSMGQADLLLASASFKARSWNTNSSMQFVKVKSLLPLHPVGSWRPETWTRTQERKRAVLSAKAAIIANSNKLSMKLTEELPELAIMKSITPFLAVPFQYCGKENVLFEGNGRMKALKLAAQEDPELGDIEVEVELLSYRPETLAWVQKGVQELWNQYLTEAEELEVANKGHPNTEVLKHIQEYYTFKFGIVKCRGIGEGPCPVYSDGVLKRVVEKGSLLGVSKVMIVRPPQGSQHNHAVKYQLCDDGADRAAGQGKEYLFDNDLQSVKEYCPKCFDRVSLLRKKTSRL